MTNVPHFVYYHLFFEVYITILIQLVLPKATAKWHLQMPNALKALHFHIQNQYQTFHSFKLPSKVPIQNNVSKPGLKAEFTRSFIGAAKRFLTTNFQYQNNKHGK